MFVVCLELSNGKVLPHMEMLVVGKGSRDEIRDEAQ